jgi:MmyB-like transcription regulator ligand binding domain
MPAAGDPAALGQLLRSRRERLTPAEAGLPPDSFGGRRRRTAGPSAQVLDALAAALRMSAAERRYLHVLDWWPRHDVAPIGGSGTKKLRHPRLGPVEYSHVVLQVGDRPDQTLVTYSHLGNM